MRMSIPYRWMRQFGRRVVLLVISVFVFKVCVYYFKQHRRIPYDIVSTSIANQVCVHPRLQTWPSSMVKPADPPQLSCHVVEPNWVSVRNSTLIISPESERKHGEIFCNYAPVGRGRTDFDVAVGSVTKNVKTGFQIDSDFFEIKCVAKDGRNYKNIHSAIARQKAVDKRPIVMNPKHRPPPNIVMFGFDSTSRMAWLRYLPKTHAYFVNVLGGIVMEGYNIVGDGTPQALLPILTGKNETELPEARRGHHGAKPVDGHPWIWKRLKREGYVTQYGEDMGWIGTFQYRMLGFKAKPVDHFFRPFDLHIHAENNGNPQGCLGSQSKHANMLNWVQEFMSVYRNRSKFSFMFHSDYSHDGLRLKLADDDMVAFMRKLQDEKHLDNTVLILMADHGARFTDSRQSVQGKQEERMPYMAIRLPPSLTKPFPATLRNLKINAGRLTTPFDIHETFLDIIEYDSVNTTGDVSRRAVSLLKEIPASRSCKDAEIEMHWCACLQWATIGVYDKNAQRSAYELLRVINSMTIKQRDLCVELSIKSITSAQMFAPNNKLLQFKQSADTDGYMADLTDKMKIDEVHYQITIVTLPGMAIYEATVKFGVNSGVFSLDSHEISRTNRYRDQPHCVASELPHLRQYCYCRVQLEK